ncbi:MAG: rhomboid family intramembrane serine protease [Nanoarchaeota archaeon]
MTVLQNLTQELHNAQALKNKKKEAQAYFNLGNFFLDEENYVRARFFYEQTLKLDSEFPNANFKLALVAIEFNELEIAKKCLKRELRLNKNHPYAKDLLEHVKVHSNFPIITLSLVLINLIVFIAFRGNPTTAQILKYGFSQGFFDIYHGIFSLFVHAGILHFVLNVFFLLMFGLVLEKKLGSFWFLGLYFFAGLVGNYMEVIIGGSDVFVVGCSSALFGLVGALLMRSPMLSMRVFGIFKLPVIFVFSLFFVVLEMLVSYFPEVFNGVGHYAHLFGFFAGMLFMGLFFRETIPVFYVWTFTAFGFWIMSFGLRGFFGDFGVGDVFVRIFMVVFGLGIAFFSYEHLRHFKKDWGEEE